jgi:hypothetical protein
MMFTAGGVLGAIGRPGRCRSGMDALAATASGRRPRNASGPRTQEKFGQMLRVGEN